MEDELQHKIKEIDELTNKIKKIQAKLDEARQKEFAKSEEKYKLSQALHDLEEKKIKKLSKLEKLKNYVDKFNRRIRLDAEDETQDKDFEFKPKDAYKFLPNSALDGLRDIQNSLDELKNTLNTENKPQLKSMEEYVYKSVQIKHEGNAIDFYAPHKSDYSFRDLIYEACEIFCLRDPENYIITDELNNIYPLHISLKTFVKKNVDRVLFLQCKKESTNKNEEDKLERGNKMDLQNINNYFENDPGLNQKLQNFKENEEGEHKMQTNRNKAFLKKNRWIEIVLMIEKTFGSRITFLIFYLCFVGIILYSMISKQNVIDKSKMYVAIKNQFLFPEFSVNLKTVNFVDRMEKLMDLKVKIDFNEINDVRLFPLWFEQVFLENLGFYTKEFTFLEKHQLMGKMRFLQIREDPVPECDDIPSYYTDSAKDISSCFKEDFKRSEDPFLNFNCSVLKDNIKADNAFKAIILPDMTPPNVYVINQSMCNDTKEYDPNLFNNPCKYQADPKQLKESNPFICKLQQFAFKIRNLTRNIADFSYPNTTTIVNQQFLYNGLINNYKIDKAYYLDLDFYNISQMYNFTSDYNLTANDTNSMKNTYKRHLKEFSDQVFLSWVDYNTRLLFISFNIYKTSPEEIEELISVSFYFEFSKTQFIQKKYDILFFRKQDFELNYYLYFFMLFVYSITYLYFNIIEIYKERMNIIYKQFIMFLINFSLNCLILLVLILKIYLYVDAINIIKPYNNNRFQEYFPINNYVQIENYIFMLELFMIAIIILNIMNSFYFELFARIFLTFKYMWRHLVSYMVIYLIVVISFTTSCFMLYGNHIMEFSTWSKSFYTLIILNYVNISVLNNMVYYNPFISRLIFFSYYFVFQFIMINIIFIIFLRAYNKVKKTEPVSSLSFRLLLDGLIEFFKNLYLKYAAANLNFIKDQVINN